MLLRVPSPPSSSFISREEVQVENSARGCLRLQGAYQRNFVWTGRLCRLIGTLRPRRRRLEETAPSFTLLYRAVQRFLASLRACTRCTYRSQSYVAEEEGSALYSRKDPHRCLFIRDAMVLDEPESDFGETTESVFSSVIDCTAVIGHCLRRRRRRCRRRPWHVVFSFATPAFSLKHR
jgi:hypothetical protein